MNLIKEHWDKVFKATEQDKLGWFEPDASQTLSFLKEIPVSGKTIFLPGAGTSILIEELAGKGAGLIVNDISEEALNQSRLKIDPLDDRIIWLCQDISRPFKEQLPGVDIWIDRAVLHFLLVEEDISGYFKNLKSILKKDGYAMFAEFSLTGAKKCSGLDLHRYSTELLQKRLGDGFELIKDSEYNYINPRGEPRPYIYSLFRRTI